MIIYEPEFRVEIYRLLEPLRGHFRSVCGPGRSGAVASVYASHYLGIPWVPRPVSGLQPVLVVDTAVMSGATLRKAVRKAGVGAHGLAVFNEPPRVMFWYEQTFL